MGANGPLQVEDVLVVAQEAGQAQEVVPVGAAGALCGGDAPSHLLQWCRSQVMRVVQGCDVDGGINGALEGLDGDEVSRVASLFTVVELASDAVSVFTCDAEEVAPGLCIGVRQEVGDAAWIAWDASMI